MLAIFAFGFHSLSGRLASAAALAFAIASVPGGPLGAQSDDVDPFHWGYAAAFGRGLYRLGDGTEAQIYRMQFKPPLRKAPDGENEGPGIRLVLPVTLGLQDFGVDRLPLDRPADRVEQVSFMPGLELEFAPGERVTIRTSAQAGRGWELEGAEQSARLASVGVRSRVKFVDAPGRPALITGLLWAGFDPSEGERRSLLRVSAGLELDVAARSWQVRGHPVRWLPHVLVDRYYRPPSALALGDVSHDDEPGVIERERQVGLAVGRDEPFKILFLKFDAVGVAYRFSDRSKGIRIYLNSVF
jgi:hypothetical protein